MSEKSAVYECVDREHDAWRCRACGYIENFEADGPTENGWHFCPGCGREIIVEAVNPCPFDNDNCMCQFCETPCNNGLNCSDCAHEGKAVHDVSGKRGDGMSGRTTERILNAAAKGLLFLFLYVMLDLCWIGAECVFEGIVHESRVDGVVLAWLCLLLVREIEQFERKIRGDGR